MGKYETFREQYPEFIYESYDIEVQDGKVLLTYHFSVPGLRDFAPPVVAFEFVFVSNILISFT